MSNEKYSDDKCLFTQSERVSTETIEHLEKHVDALQYLRRGLVNKLADFVISHHADSISELGSPGLREIRISLVICNRSQFQDKINERRAMSQREGYQRAIRDMRYYLDTNNVTNMDTRAIIDAMWDGFTLYSKQQS